MTVAIMQPYIFPYIGYYQLVGAVDHFVFYDDVQYMKGGWLNRNNILVNGQKHLFTIPLKNASIHQNIGEVEVLRGKPWQKKLLRTIEQNYRKAPQFDSVFPLVSSVFQTDSNKLSEMAISSIQIVADYLDLKTRLLTSSEHFEELKGRDAQDRLIKICKSMNATNYINPIGGQSLYQKEVFADQQITLSFLQTHPHEYEQFGNTFVPYLSMIDLLMFNDKPALGALLKQYSLI